MTAMQRFRTLQERNGPTVLVDNISVSFAARGGKMVTPLAETTLRIAEGEIVALVGRSGVGKTTLLHAIAGLVPVWEGAIWVQGRRVERPRPDIGVVFQDHLLFPWRTALGNVAFPLEVRRFGRRERGARAREWLDLVGLGPHAHRFVHQLSGGMKQRVAIARALATEAPVLLLDEPFSALDTATRERVQALLARTVEEKGQTILLVSHNLEDAAVLADRILVMAGAPSRIVFELEVRGNGAGDRDALVRKVRWLLSTYGDEVAGDSTLEPIG